MFGSKYRSLLADRDGALALIHRLLTEQAASHWKRYVLALALMAVAAAATGAAAYLLGDVINAAYVDKNLTAIVALAGATVVLFVLKSAATYGQTLILARIGNHILAENQRRMFGSLIRQNIEFFAQRHSSEFLMRLAVGAQAATNIINLLVTSVGRDFLTLIALVIVMAAQEPVLSAISLVVAPPAILFLRKLVRRIRVVASDQFVGGTRILETLQETVQGIRIIKAFTLEDSMRQRLDTNVAQLERESNKWARLAHRASPLMEALGGIAIGLTLIYAGYGVVHGGSAPGQFVSFLAAFLLAYEPAKRLARLNLDLHTALVSVRFLFEIIDAPPTEPDEGDKPALALAAGRIEFNNVRFGYRAGDTVLHGLSFAAEPGKVTALVGPSGGGKSTVFNLVLRFFDPDSGSISIDGQDISSVSRHSLRRSIAHVSQDVFLFHGSIRDNIAFGKPDATESEIMAAAKAAHAHEFILGFPSGYDTPVGERGAQLSGGERQRIAIARALIKNAPIILLDEATASLDSESEQLVQDAIAHLCQGRTTLVIAHRLHTITQADRILVMDNGSIIESGRHDELLRKGGRYAAFYRLQIKDQEPGPALPLASTA